MVDAAQAELAAKLERRASMTDAPGTPPTPGPSAGKQPRGLSVTPSFPKAALENGHAELRAGLRFLSHGYGDSGDGKGADTSSAVQVKLGLGINTGAGIKDNSVGFKALGCGLQLGQRTGISIFDNEVVVDFGKLFGISEAKNDSPPDDDFSMLSCISPPKGAARTNGVPRLQDAGALEEAEKDAAAAMIQSARAAAAVANRRARDDVPTYM